MVSTEDIKKLRDDTGVSITLCKSVLEEADGDYIRAIEMLKNKGAAMAQKKSSRVLGSGTVASYVHGNRKIGAMVELLSETDFVAKNEEFVGLAKDLAMHISAAAPQNTEELLAQSFIKDESKVVRDLIEAAIQKFGERIEIGQIARFSLN